MKIDYDAQKLKQATMDFYNATGINIMVLEPDFSAYNGLDLIEPNPYCKAIHNIHSQERVCWNSDKYLLQKCKESKKSEIHMCHAGLIDVAVPLIYNDSILGYIILGQMRQNDDYSSVRKRLAKLGLDTPEMEENYMKLPLFDSQKIKSIENLAVMLAKYILFENMIRPEAGSDVSRITEYIKQNLNSDLSIHSIAKATNFSKSSMYKIFHENFNCTVNKYITMKRVDHAEQLLKNTDLPVDMIASCVGFSSTSYFSRSFKSIKGITPSQFRKPR